MATSLRQDGFRKYAYCRVCGVVHPTEGTGCCGRVRQATTVRDERFYVPLERTPTRPPQQEVEDAP